MAASETQVTWSSSNSSTLSGGGNDTSDAFSISSAVINGAVQIKAEHGGTPDETDIVRFWILGTLGDPDGTGSDEYDTETQGVPLGKLNLSKNNPSLKTVPLPNVAMKKAKIYAENNAQENVTVSATTYLIEGGPAVIDGGEF